MKILILGGTGSVGRHLVAQALDRGHEVTALVRDPGKVSGRNPRLRLVEGNALDPAAVERAVKGQEAVIYSLGVENTKPTTLFSDSTRILIAAMEQLGVRRLIAITGIGAGDSRGHGGFLYDRVIFPLFTKHRYADKDRQEALIRNSSLDWIIVRPAAYSDGGRRGDFRVATDLEGITMRSISRADVAAFVLAQLTNDTYLKKTPLIGH